jgi:hypothetical protein
VSASQCLSVPPSGREAFLMSLAPQMPFAVLPCLYTHGHRLICRAATELPARVGMAETSEAHRPALHGEYCHVEVCLMRVGYLLPLLGSTPGPHRAGAQSSIGAHLAQAYASAARKPVGQARRVTVAPRRMVAPQPRRTDRMPTPEGRVREASSVLRLRERSQRPGPESRARGSHQAHARSIKIGGIVDAITDW